MKCQFQAYNSRGSGPSSNAVTARTLEDAPSLPPENIKCQVLSAQSVRITWEPPLPEGRNGKIQGYKVTYHSISEWFGKLWIQLSGIRFKENFVKRRYRRPRD